MTKEIAPNNGGNIHKIDKSFNFMVNGEFDIFLNKIRMIKETYTEASEADELNDEIKFHYDSLIEEINRLKAEINSMEVLKAEDDSIEFKTESGDTIYIKEWKTKLEQINSILNKVKKTRKKKVDNTVKPASNEDRTAIVDEGTTNQENQEQASDTANKKGISKPQVVDLMSSDKKIVKEKYISISDKITGLVNKLGEDNISGETIKEAEDFIKEERTRLTNLNVSKFTKPDQKIIGRDLRLLELLEVKLAQTEQRKPEDKTGNQSKVVKNLEELKIPSLSEYDDVIYGFIVDPKTRNEALKNRSAALKQLKQKLIETGDEDLRSKSIASIENLISEIRSIKLVGGDTLIQTLEGDIFEIKKAKPEEEKKDIKIDNKREQTKQGFDQQINEKVNEYNSIKDEIFKFKEEIESTEGGVKKHKKGKIRKFINKNLEEIAVLIKYIKAVGVKDNGRKKLDILTKDEELLKKLGRVLDGEKDVFGQKPEAKNEDEENKEVIDNTETKTDEEKEESFETEEDDERFEKIDLLSKLSNEDIAILQTKQDLYQAVLSSVETYNNLIDTNAGIEEIRGAFSKVEKNRKKWLGYKHWFKNEREFKEIKTKAPGKLDIGDEEDVAQKHINASKRNKLSPIPKDIKNKPSTVGELPPMPVENENTEATPVLNIPPMPVEKNTEKISSTVTQDTFEAPTKAAAEIIDIHPLEVDGIATEVSLDKIFTFEKGYDYSEMLEDKDFNNWISNIYNHLKRENRNNAYEVKDLKEWYKSYQESLPYYAKLLEILSTEGQTLEDIKFLMMDSQVNEWMYDLYNNKPGTKEKIINIYNSYKSRKDNEVEIKKLKDLAALQTNISENRGDRELRTDHVKSLLESKGRVNTETNFAQLTNFLLNMKNNYSSYSAGIKDERESENVANIIGKFVRNPKGSEGSMNWVQSAWSRISLANLWRKPSPDDINRYAPLIDEIRRQNLVERIGKGDRQETANLARMNNLLSLMENKRDLLLQYAENPQSVSEEVEALDQSDRESLAIFIAMYNKFAEQRYRTNAGKSEAERLLKQNIDTSSLESSISKDEIFSDLNPSELKQLENKALYENALESLNKLGHQIDTFPKTKIDSKFTQKISDTFDFVEKTLTTSDSLATEADLLKLKKIKIKISELIIRHTNKNNFKELSPSLIQYDTVFEADEVPDENKKEFANSLVKSLKAHRDNPKNTTFQNAMLDNLIETYSKKL